MYHQRERESISLFKHRKNHFRKFNTFVFLAPREEVGRAYAIHLASASGADLKSCSEVIELTNQKRPF